MPFADHCEPLTSAGPESAELMAALRDATAHTWQYVELRPRTAGAWNRPEFERTASFRLHTLDVRPPLDELFRRLHRSTMQRKVRRAEREGLVYEEGCSTALLNDFYRLLLLTRRRHRVPPQPIEWFANLIACLPDRAKIAVAKWEGWSDSGHADDPAWATLRCTNTAVRMPASTISAPSLAFLEGDRGCQGAWRDLIRPWPVRSRQPWIYYLQGPPWGDLREVFVHAGVDSLPSEAAVTLVGGDAGSDTVTAA